MLKTVNLKAFDAFASGSDGPEWILVARKGENKTTNGTFFMGDDDAAKVIARFKGMGNDLVVDFEHQTLKGHESPDGKAPAAGWIDRLSWITSGNDAPDGETVGLWAHVKHWTPTALEMILDREYRYLSPVVSIDTKTQRVQSLFSVALTNTPAMQNAPSLAAKQETEMQTLKQLRKTAAKLLGPAAVKRVELSTVNGDTDPLEVLSQVLLAFADMPPTAGEAGAAVTESVLPELWAKIAEQVGVEPGASQEEILRAVLEALAGGGEEESGDEEGGEGGGEEVANKIVTAMSKRLEVLEKQNSELLCAKQETDFDSLMSGYVKDARVTPGELKDCRAEYLEMFKAKPDALKKMLGARQAIVSHGREVDEGAGSAGRSEIIMAAKREWEGDGGCQVASKDAYVDDALRLKGMELMTGDERKQCG